MNKKLKTALQFIFGFPLLWGLMAVFGVIAASPILTGLAIVSLGVIGIALRKWQEWREEK